MQALILVDRVKTPLIAGMTLGERGNHRSEKVKMGKNISFLNNKME